MSKANFDAVPDVDIDEGVFKYVYIRYSTYQIIFSEIVNVHFFSDARIYCEAGEDDRHEKDIVRGYTFAEYHADVYDKTECEVTGADLDCECLGGGRIEHRPGDKYIKVDNEFMYHYELSIIEGLWLQHGLRKSKSCKNCGDITDQVQRL